jgi:2OG-Fe(II) oxygenase superfamily
MTDPSIIESKPPRFYPNDATPMPCHRLPLVVIMTKFLNQGRFSGKVALQVLFWCVWFSHHPSSSFLCCWTVYSWVRDCGQASPAIQMTLLQAILTVSSMSSSSADSTLATDDVANDNNLHNPRVALSNLATTTTTAATPPDEITHLPGWKWWIQEDPLSEDYNHNVLDEEEDEVDDDPLKEEQQPQQQPPAQVLDSGASHNDNAKEQEEKAGAACTAVFREEDVSFSHASIVYREAAADRTPPNHFDLHLHGNVTIRWDGDPTTVTNEHEKDNDDDGVEKKMSPDRDKDPKPRTMMTKIHVREIPFLPYPSRVIASALSRNECQRLIYLMTQLSFRPDHPTHLAAPTGIDSCEVMMDDKSCDILSQRVNPFLPATLTSVDGKKTVLELHSINPRWRGFRYGRHCTYRPHLDGSWPLCYMTKEGQYHCCNGPEPKQQGDANANAATTAVADTTTSVNNIKSFLTFLIYLNNDFEGGETKFYLPHHLARGVVPRAGSILIFPQGNLASLIHEGAAVTKGVKYVIRTDVLYRPRRKTD